MSMSARQLRDRGRDAEVVADAVRVEHLDRVHRRGGRDLQDQSGDERAVAGLVVGVAVTLDVPDVVAAGRALDALEPLVVEHAGVEHGDPHALAVAGRGRAQRQRRGLRRGPHGRARPALQARLAVEVDRRRRRLPHEHVVGRHLRRALRAVGRGPADLRQRGQDLLGRIGGLRRAREQRDAERALLALAPAGQHPRHVRRVAGAGEDLARPQQERVPGVVIDRDRARVPLPGQFARAKRTRRPSPAPRPPPRAQAPAAPRSAC